MNHPRLAAFTAVAVTLALCACHTDGEAPASSKPTDPVTPLSFSVEGRASDSPSVSVRGTTVAVVWRASVESQQDVFLSVSTDAGAHFSAPVRVNDIDGDGRASGEQAPRVALGADAIHVVWPSKRDGHSVIRYARSIDGGRSFSPAVSIAGAALTGARGWEAATVTYDGAVHAVWLDGRNADARGAASNHASHGSQKSPPASHKHTGGSGNMPDRSPRQDVFYASFGAGEAPREALLASNVCFCCKTAIVASGDNVYAAWRHIYPGNLRDIAFARSADRGRTFGAPVRLSDDGWRIEGCPDDGPALAADAHGGIHVVWPTLVAGETPRKGIFYASLAGETVTPRLRVDSGDSDPAHPQLAADDHGTAAVAWDERANNTRRIVLRAVSGGHAGTPQFFEGAGVSYPAVAAVQGHWILVWSNQKADGGSVIEGRRIPLAAH
jgi:hypothetical protein